jgi:hypothetical protein
LDRVLNCRTVKGRLAIDLLPELDDRPDLRRDVLRTLGPLDLYLILVARLDQLVVRRDLRTSTIEECVAKAGWSIWMLRSTALRARTSRYIRGGQLTPHGWRVAAAALGRLERLVDDHAPRVEPGRDPRRSDREARRRVWLYSRPTRT